MKQQKAQWKIYLSFKHNMSTMLTNQLKLWKENLDS